MKKPSIINLFRRKREKGKELPCERLNYRLCPYCHGSGINNDSKTNTLSTQPQRCPICGGVGRTPI
jgi:DnaJ-class molecular chaperone